MRSPRLHQQAARATKTRSLAFIGLVAFILACESYSLPAAEEDARAKEAQPAEPGGVAAPMQHYALVFSAQFSPDGKRIVTASKDNTARLWSVTGEPIGEPMRHEGKVNSAQFSPDGKLVVTASADKTARLWDAASGRAIGQPMRHDEEVLSARFSPDGQRVVTASSDTARVWVASHQTGPKTGAAAR